MEVVPNVHWIKCGSVNAYAVIEPSGITVIDTGFAPDVDRILLYLRDRGHGPEAIKRIILTHRHPDHVGGASGLKRATGAEVLAHVLDTTAISEQPSLSLPRPPIGTMMKLFAGKKLIPPPCVVDGALEDGTVLPVLGGLRVLWTPGHTHGHCSLYLVQKRLLFAGDAVMTMGGKVRPTFGFLADDFAELCRTIRDRLAVLPIDHVLAGHGDPLQKDVPAHFQRLARRYTGM